MIMIVVMTTIASEVKQQRCILEMVCANQIIALGIWKWNVVSATSHLRVFVAGIDGHSLEESVEREYFPERFGFELFGDPFEKKRRWQEKKRKQEEAERGDLGAWTRWEREAESRTPSKKKKKRKKKKKT